MRQFFSFLLLLGLFSFFVKPVSAYYINYDGTNFNIGMMGVNCGIPNNDPVVNRCCVAYDAHWQVNSDIPLAGDAIQVIAGAGNVVLDAFEALTRFTQEAATPFLNSNADNPYCYRGVPSLTDPFSNPNACFCQMPTVTSISAIKLCEIINDPNEKQDCKDCINAEGAAVNPNGDSAGMWTGIGCVKLNLSDFIQYTIFGLVIGIAGMCALLCIIYCAFQLQISQNSPEKIKETQELLTSCITGLILIIFSIFILRFIGVDLLRIPGFN